MKLPVKQELPDLPQEAWVSAMPLKVGFTPMPQEVAPGSAKPGGWSRARGLVWIPLPTGWDTPGMWPHLLRLHFLGLIFSEPSPQAVVQGQRPNECAILHTVPDAGRLEVSL